MVLLCFYMSPLIFFLVIICALFSQILNKNKQFWECILLQNSFTPSKRRWRTFTFHILFPRVGSSILLISAIPFNGERPIRSEFWALGVPIVPRMYSSLGIFREELEILRHFKSKSIIEVFWMPLIWYRAENSWLTSSKNFRGLENQFVFNIWDNRLILKSMTCF